MLHCQPNRKPLGRKAYGHIPHLPSSRLGPGDHHVSEGQARIATQRTRDKHDHIVVQEKVDGSCVAAARIGDQIVALGRAGWTAWSSKYEQHNLFAAWVLRNEDRFRAVLRPGERAVGEWLAQAHGTRYTIAGDPFVLFDIMEETRRLTHGRMVERLKGDFTVPCSLSEGPPVSINDALSELGTYGHHGALDPVEGCVWRVERKGAVDYLAKFVRAVKLDGCYLPEVSGNAAVWNWRPPKRTVP